MSTISLVGTLLILGLLLLLGSCPPPPPPRITEFVVAPANTCAHVPVGVTWTYDGDAATLASSPHTNTPDGDLPGGRIHAGFRFDTAATDTTFTLTARRGSQTVTSTPMTAHILPNPFVTTMELSYNCAHGAWEHPEFSFQDFAEQITIQSFTNMSPQPLVLELRGQVTVLPVGVTTPILGPVQLPGGGVWRVRLRDALDPPCRGIPAGTTNEPVAGTFVPNPVSITITSSCSIQ